MPAGCDGPADCVDLPTTGGSSLVAFKSLDPELALDLARALASLAAV
jgi:hypothetical protein